jgi:hypothetical protein
MGFRQILLISAFISVPASADTFNELTRDGSRAQALLDSVATKAAGQPIQGMDLLCPNYKAFNGDRTKRSLIWKEILGLVRGPIEQSLASVDNGMSIKPLLALASAAKVARVNTYCRSLPTPYGTPEVKRVKEYERVQGPYSVGSMLKIYEPGDIPAGAPGETGTGVGIR